MIKKILKEIRLRINKFGSSYRRKKLKIKNPTIISNNCWAGIVSQYLGIKYYTPTIGLYFFSEEYIKFLERFDYYIKQKLEIIDTKDSKYYDEMIKKNHKNAIVGKLDDVEIVFLHMKTGKEAIEKWNKRVKRINRRNIIFKFCEQNECSIEHIKRFENLPFKNKICFTTKEYPEYKSVIWFKDQFKNEEVVRDYYESHKYLNIIDYINNMEEEKL
jgi:exopolysaccharide biosynthesis protein